MEFGELDNMNKTSLETSGLLPHEIEYIKKAVEIEREDLRKSNMAYGDTVESSGGDWTFDDAGSQVAAQEAHQRE